MSSVLVLNDDELLKFGLPSGALSSVYPFENNSFTVSPLVDNKYIFLVGFSNYSFPSEKVVFFDASLTQLTEGPCLLGPKLNPTVIVHDCKIFAFSNLILHQGVEKCVYKSDPIAEVLDTSSKTWTWQPIPPLPKIHPPKDSIAYSIVSSAVYTPSSPIDLGCILFLSLGSLPNTYKGDLSLAYNIHFDCWDSVSEPLPFYGEGKFVGEICFGFPTGMSRRDYAYLSSYRLVPLNSRSWRWVEICRYPLPTGHSSPIFPYLQSFVILKEDLVSVIRARYARVKSSDCRHFLEFDLIQLVPDLNEKVTHELGYSIGASKLLKNSSFGSTRDITAIVGM